MSSYTEFHKLKKVMIGRAHSSDDINIEGLSSSSERLLKKLLDETEEDLQKFVDICKTFGAEVVRPDYSHQDFDTKDQAAFGKKEIKDVFLKAYPYLLIPRNNLIALDNKIVCVNSDETIKNDYTKCLDDEVIWNEYTINDNLKTSSIVRLGKDIIVDKQKYQRSNTRKGVSFLSNWLEPLGYNIIYTPYHNFKFFDGVSHGDSCLALLKPGVLITHPKAIMYTREIFLGWDGCTVGRDSNKDLISRWHENRRVGFSYAHMGNEFDDAAFNTVITDWFQNWLGYANETVFDINVFSLDEHHVVVSNYNERMFNFFKKHKIEPIICNFRHRYFWDAGWHCLTSDLKREGTRGRYLLRHKKMD